MENFNAVSAFNTTSRESDIRSSKRRKKGHLGNTEADEQAEDEQSSSNAVDQSGSTDFDQQATEFLQQQPSHQQMRGHVRYRNTHGGRPQSHDLHTAAANPIDPELANIGKSAQKLSRGSGKDPLVHDPSMADDATKEFINHQHIHFTDSDLTGPDSADGRGYYTSGGNTGLPSLDADGDDAAAAAAAVAAIQEAEVAAAVGGVDGNTALGGGPKLVTRRTRIRKDLPNDGMLQDGFAGDGSGGLGAVGGQSVDSGLGGQHSGALGVNGGSFTPEEKEVLDNFMKHYQEVY